MSDPNEVLVKCHDEISALPDRNAQMWVVISLAIDIAAANGMTEKTFLAAVDKCVKATYEPARRVYLAAQGLTDPCG
jgi:hypothetical protein